jgi:branched-subunit amino acid aminotransferase/4-amino-4-deoxychorismate lyase
MNVMFVIDDTLVTPALSDSILAGITRDSVLKIAKLGNESGGAKNFSERTG